MLFRLALLLQFLEHGDEARFAHQATYSLLLGSVGLATMTTGDVHEMSLRFHQVIVFGGLLLTLLHSQQVPEDGPLELQEAQEVVFIGGDLVEGLVILMVKRAYYEVIALNDLL